MLKRGALNKFLRDKRGGGEDILFPVIIFIIVNLVVFGSFLAFVFKASTGSLIFEQAYAKQIALIIDRSKPSSQFKIDFSEGLEIAESVGLDKNSLVRIGGNEVIVSLGKSGGYSFEYFSDYDVSSFFDGNSLVVNVNKKEG